MTELRPRSPKNKALKPNATARVNKLVLYNGSPRRSGSNTALILRAISDAYGPNRDAFCVQAAGAHKLASVLLESAIEAKQHLPPTV